MDEIKAGILEQLKTWWCSTSKTIYELNNLINGYVIIDGYRFIATNGQITYLNALNKEADEEFTIIDCGSTATLTEFYSTLASKLGCELVQTEMPV